MNKGKKRMKPGPEVDSLLPEASSVLGKNSVFEFAKSNILAISLCSISLLVNLIVVCDYWNSPFSQVPAWDSEVYWKWAQEIAAGNWLGSIIFHQSPLYPYFLALLIVLFGKHLLLVYIVQAVFSATSAFLTYSIVKKIHQNKSIAFIAGLLFAFYGFQVFYSTKILSENLSILLMLLATRLILAVNKAVKPHVVIFAGVAFGLLLTAKPHLLIAIPFLLIYFYIVKEDLTIQELFCKVMMFLIPVILIVSTVTVRNYTVGKELVLISSNGGENFYIGNHQNANGMYTYVEGISPDIKFQNEDVNTIAQKATGRQMKRSEVSRFWFNQGKDFILSNPMQYLKLQLTKLKFIFSGAEVTNMYFHYFERANLTKSLAIPFINFYILFPLFLAGLCAAVSKWKSHFPLFVLVSINVLNLLIFFYDTRYMLLAMPYFIIFGATGLWSVLEWLRDVKSAKSLMKPVVFVLLLGVGLTAYIYSKDIDAIKPDSHLYLAMGDIYLELAKPDAALAAYRQSSHLNQGDWTPAFGAVKVCFQKGSKDLAAQLYSGAMPFLSDDFRKEISRDKNLDGVRAYIELKKSADKDYLAGLPSLLNPQSLLARIPET